MFSDRNNIIQTLDGLGMFGGGGGRVQGDNRNLSCLGRNPGHSRAEVRLSA